MRKKEYYAEAHHTEGELTKLVPRLRKVYEIFSHYRFESILDVGWGMANLHYY